MNFFFLCRLIFAQRAIRERFVGLNELFTEEVDSASYSYHVLKSELKQSIEPSNVIYTALITSIINR